MNLQVPTYKVFSDKQDGFGIKAFREGEQEQVILPSRITKLNTKGEILTIRRFSRLEAIRAKTWLESQQFTKVSDLRIIILQHIN